MDSHRRWVPDAGRYEKGTEEKAGTVIIPIQIPAFPSA